MKRAIIFAHYDKHNIIDDYVVYYLKSLKQFASEVVFVSDSNVQKDQLEKIGHLISKSIVGHHGEYDFGSYKRGFFSLENIEQYDEIIICNDSCYAPLFPFEDLFSEMQTRNCDFWGITQNHYGYEKKGNRCSRKKGEEHVQSYFVVLRKNTFTSPEFNNFMSSVKKENNKKLVILNYEIGMTKTLTQAGFTKDSYVPMSTVHRGFAYFRWHRNLIKYKTPTLKVNVFKNPTFYYRSWKKLLKEGTDYPIELIQNHIKRVKSFNRIFSIGRFYILIFGCTFAVNYFGLCIFNKWFYFKKID